MRTIKIEFPIDDIYTEYQFERRKTYDTESIDEPIEKWQYIPYITIKLGRNTRSLKASINKLNAALQAMQLFGASSVYNSGITMDAILSLAEAKDVVTINLLNIPDDLLVTLMSIDPKEYKLAKKEFLEKLDDNLAWIEDFKNDIKNFEEKFPDELKLLLELEED